MSESVFAKIIRGEIPVSKVYEDERILAFLDIQPINPGHTLVIPKKEIDYFFDLPDDLYAGLMVVCKKIEPAMKKATGAKKIGVAVYGMEVAHAHVHLIPLHKVGDFNFSRAKPASYEELDAMAKKIRSMM